MISLLPYLPSLSQRRRSHKVKDKIKVEIDKEYS